MSPVHCIPKKGGITVKPNENNELIPHRTIVGYQMCIDYRKLNRATKKENQPLLLLEQILEKLSANSYFCHLDGFTGISQIMVKPEDQEKATFMFWSLQHNNYLSAMHALFV